MKPGPNDQPGTGGAHPLIPRYSIKSTFEEFSQALKLVDPELLLPDDIQRLAESRSSRLFAHHTDLRNILERHETTIQKRWIKKTKSQRQAVLLKAWPNMAAAHRPDFQAFRNLNRPHMTLTSLIEKHRDSFIWPYINQDDLSKPKLLPLLLNARGRHNPCDFAAADRDAMHVGRLVYPLAPRSASQHIMILNGAVGPEDYGKLVACDGYADVHDWVSKRWQFLPGDGLLILEAQEKLLEFLVSCCKLILHETPHQTLTSDAFPIMPPSQLKTEVDAGGFHSLAIMAAEAPYRVPEHLDFGCIESLLAAKASAIEDHVWSLREDPGYFADSQRELMEHRLEHIKDTHGRPGPLLGSVTSYTFQTVIICSLLDEAYGQLETFSDLQRQAHELNVLQNKYASAISPSEALPKEYLQAILKFRYHLREVAWGPCTRFYHHAMGSPPLRRLFVRLSPADASSSPPTIFPRFDLNMSETEMELTNLFSIMWMSAQASLFGLMQVVVGELQRLLDTDQKAKELVTPYVAGFIGTVSLISQCITQIELYQPWASGFDHDMAEYKDDIEKQLRKKSSDLRAKARWNREKNMRPAVGLSDISRGRFAYPLEKRRTKGNVEILRQSEANLDAFWACVDELMQVQAGGLEGTAIGHLLSQTRNIQRTPEWTEPIKKPKRTEAGPASGQDVEALYKPLSALYFGPAPSKTNVTDADLAKTKIKTRGTATVPQIAADAALNPSEGLGSSDTQPIIPVDARSLKVFRTLFFNPSPTATPGEVAWNDFLHALTSTGFTAEKLYGSVWLFKPAALDADRSIQFHEPHPSGKISFRVARRHGRRLNRAYGWTGDTFTLKKK